MPTHPTQPDALTEAEIEALVAARVAEELAKMTGDAEGATLTAQEIAQTALRSTVFLNIKTQGKSYYGSGFVVREGLIATCEHVLDGMVSGTAESVFDEKKYPLTEIVAASEKNDLAIVGVQDFTAPALPLGDSNTVQVGETIFVVGNPRQLKGTFSQGIISGVRHEQKGRMIQMTASTATGSSGGPVLNGKGKVIGIYSETEIGAQNLNFAVSVNHLKTLLATIR